MTPEDGQRFLQNLASTLDWERDRLEELLKGFAMDAELLGLAALVNSAAAQGECHTKAEATLELRLMQRGALDPPS